MYLHPGGCRLVKGFGVQIIVHGLTPKGNSLEVGQMYGKDLNRVVCREVAMSLIFVGILFGLLGR